MIIYDDSKVDRTYAHRDYEYFSSNKILRGKISMLMHLCNRRAVPFSRFSLNIPEGLF